MRGYDVVDFRDVITLCIEWRGMRGLVTFAKSGPFLRSALQQLQIEIDIHSTFVLDANTEVWKLN